MSERYERQSFLGPDSASRLARSRVGLVGLGGGGSHIVQQLAHLGFEELVLVDPDRVETSNLNRLVGATELDAETGARKVDVAERVIRGVNGQARVTKITQRWEEAPEHLRACDVLFACVDTLSARDGLERLARRYLIPLIDIGLDVHTIEPEPPRMTGQVFASIPGGPCMRCVRLLDDDALAREAGRYGDAGGRPQVVWANGVLASTAVGIAVDLLTGWTRATRPSVYLCYDANEGKLSDSPRLGAAPPVCPHFAPGEVGAPSFAIV